VATGSIKAIEALIVAGNISKSGFISIETASPANMGRAISVVAVLEVSSVKKVMLKAIMAMISRMGMPCVSLINSPIQSDNPEDLNAPAKAKPPPKSNTIFQGNPEAVSQSMRRFPLFSDEGMRKVISENKRFIKKQCFFDNFNDYSDDSYGDAYRGDRVAWKMLLEPFLYTLDKSYLKLQKI